MIWIVIASRYDDWELLGASTDHDKAKQIKRDAVDHESHWEYSDIAIIEAKDGVMLT